MIFWSRGDRGAFYVAGFGIGVVGAIERGGRGGAIANPSPPTTIAPTAPPTTIARASVPSYFGHLPYDEAIPDRLVSIGKFERENHVREEALDLEAAQAFQVMVNAARSQGIQLMGISGFRNIPDQRALFDKQIERRGSAAAAAQLSAPPGHSEHRTGYALDITDASRTDVDLKVAFEETAAYQWLVPSVRVTLSVVIEGQAITTDSGISSIYTLSAVRI